MFQETVEKLLNQPGRSGSWRGRARSVVTLGDVVPNGPEIKAMEGFLAQRQFAPALKLAEGNLSGERRNETLRLLATRMALDPAFLETAAGDLKDAAAARQPCVVRAALYLVACLAIRRQPDLSLVSPLVWTASLRWLFDYLEPEALRAASHVICTRYPEQRFLRRLHDAASLVPARLDGDRFTDRLDAAAQLVRHVGEGSSGLLVCFCGFHGRMGIPLNFIDRWAQQAGFHVLYLRDLSQSHYRQGVSAFGENMADTRQAIGAIAQGLGCRHVAFYGSSMGGLVAIRTGIALGSARILCAAGTADVAPRPDGSRLTPDEKLAVTREEAQRLSGELQQGVPGRLAYLYGSDNDRDSIIAHAIMGIPGVEAMTLSELNRHNIDFHLVMTGRYHRTFDWLAGHADDIGLLP